MPATVEKVMSLSIERADRLSKLARGRGATEDDLVGKALDLLFAMAHEGGPGDERRAWHAMGMKAMERVWGNDAEAAYDNWRELYGVAEG